MVERDEYKGCFARSARVGEPFLHKALGGMFCRVGVLAGGASFGFETGMLELLSRAFRIRFVRVLFRVV